MIEEKIEELNEEFKPWKDIEESREYYIEEKHINSREDVKFKTIVDVCNSFGENLEGM